MTITGDVSSTSLVDVTFKVGSQQRAHIRGIRSKLYYRANRSFWRQSAGL